jgi:signal transduction histidine kinase
VQDQQRGSVVSINHDGPHQSGSRSKGDDSALAQASLSAVAAHAAPSITVAVSWYADVSLHRFAYVGPMAVRLLGFPVSAWMEENFWASHVPADEREMIEMQRKRLVAEGADFELNYHMIAADGSLTRIRELATVTQLADGSRVLRGLLLRNDNAPFGNTVPASATSFSAWLSHELSQPLGVVLANANAMRHLLRASPPRVDEALEALADIAQSARDAASLLAVARRSIRNTDGASSAPTDRPERVD